MAILLHGTTRQRAERIVARGPDPNFIEPGGGPRAENFSTFLEAGPFTLETPFDYAVGKSRNFPNEGGPVILKIDVPDEIIDQIDLVLFPRSSGLVQFDRGFGLEVLLAAWPNLGKLIETVEYP